MVALTVLHLHFSLPETPEDDADLWYAGFVAENVAVSGDPAKLGCGLLKNIMCDTATKCTANDIRLMNIVAAVLHEHNTAEKILIRTGGFLPNVSAFEGGFADIKQANIVNDFVGHLKWKVERSSVKFPTGLTKEGDLCQMLLDAGVGVAIDKVLDDSKNEETIRYVLVCNINFSTSKECEKRIHEELAMYAIEDVHHATNAAVQEKALTALCILCILSPIKMTLVDMDANNPLDVFEKIPVVEHHVVHVLFGLSSEEDAIKKMVELNVLPEISPDNKIAMDNYCGFLANMAKKAEHHEYLLSNIQTVLNVIKMTTSPRAVIFGINSITNLTSKEETRKNLRLTEVVPSAHGQLKNDNNMERTVVAMFPTLSNTTFNTVLKEALWNNSVFEIVRKIVASSLVETLAFSPHLSRRPSSFPPTLSPFVFCSNHPFSLFVFQLLHLLND